MRLPLIFVLLLSGFMVRSQDSPGARVAALGGAGTTSEDVWSLYHNQSGIAQLTKLEAGAFFQSRFMVKELADKGVALAVPLSFGAIGISYKSFGYSAFTSDKTGIALAMKFNERFSGGVQIDYFSVRIAEGYGTQRAVGVEGGFQYKLTQKLMLAGSVVNPNRSKLASFNDERMPSLLRFGAAYRFSEKLHLIGEVRKTSEHTARACGGVEYHTNESFVLRAGFATFPTSTSFGFGYKVKSFQTDITAAYHSTLGFTPQISLTFSPFKSAQ